MYKHMFLMIFFMVNLSFNFLHASQAENNFKYKKEKNCPYCECSEYDLENVSITQEKGLIFINTRCSSIEGTIYTSIIPDPDFENTYIQHICIEDCSYIQRNLERKLTREKFNILYQKVLKDTCNK